MPSFASYMPSLHFMSASSYIIFSPRTILILDCHHDLVRPEGNGSNGKSILLPSLHPSLCIYIWGILCSGSFMCHSGWAIHQVWKMVFTHRTRHYRNNSRVPFLLLLLLFLKLLFKSLLSSLFQL